MATVSEQRLYQILLAPIVSEKSTRLADKNRQVAFEVRTDANKQEVKAAVEKAFEVEVKSVQIVNVRGKIKRFGRTPGQRRNWKKAYVRLKEGFDIDFMGAEG